MELPLVREASAAASAAFLRAQVEATAALAAEHNASTGPDGPRLLPLCIELQVAIVNKASSDK